MPGNGPLILRGLGPSRDIFPQGPAFRAARASRPPSLSSKKLAPIGLSHQNGGHGLRPPAKFGCLSCNKIEGRPRSTPNPTSRNVACRPLKPPTARRAQAVPASKGARLWSAGALESLKENIERLEQKGPGARTRKATPRASRVTFGASPVTIELAIETEKPPSTSQLSLPAPAPARQEPALKVPSLPSAEPDELLKESAAAPRDGCAPREEELCICLPSKEVMEASRERSRAVCAHRKLQQRMQKLLLERRRALIEDPIPESPCQSQFSSFNSDFARSASKTPSEHETLADSSSAADTSRPCSPLQFFGFADQTTECDSDDFMSASGAR